VPLLTVTEGDPVQAELGSLHAAKSSPVHQVLQGTRFYQSTKGRARTMWLILSDLCIWLLSPKSILKSHLSHPLHHSYNHCNFSLKMGLSFGICLL